MSSGDAVLFPVSFIETSSERVVRKFRRVVYQCWNMRLILQSFLKNQTKMNDDLRLLKGTAFFSKTRLRERVICFILSIVME